MPIEKWMGEEDVRSLSTVLQTKGISIFVGPSGCGKTASLLGIVQPFDAKIVPWTRCVDCDDTFRTFVRLGLQATSEETYSVCLLPVHHVAEEYVEAFAKGIAAISSRLVLRKLVIVSQELRGKTTRLYHALNESVRVAPNTRRWSLVHSTHHREHASEGARRANRVTVLPDHEGATCVRVKFAALSDACIQRRIAHVLALLEKGEAWMLENPNGHSARLPHTSQRLRSAFLAFCAGNGHRATIAALEIAMSESTADAIQQLKMLSKHSASKNIFEETKALMNNPESLSIHAFRLYDPHQRMLMSMVRANAFLGSSSHIHRAEGRGVPNNKSLAKLHGATCTFQLMSELVYWSRDPRTGRCTTFGQRFGTWALQKGICLARDGPGMRQVRQKLVYYGGSVRVPSYNHACEALSKDDALRRIQQGWLSARSPGRRSPRRTVVGDVDNVAESVQAFLDGKDTRPVTRGMEQYAKWESSMRWLQTLNLSRFPIAEVDTTLARVCSGQ